MRDPHWRGLFYFSLVSMIIHFAIMYRLLREAPLNAIALLCMTFCTGYAYALSRRK